MPGSALSTTDRTALSSSLPARPGSTSGVTSSRRHAVGGRWWATGRGTDQLPLGGGSAVNRDAG
ncbi:hypothetical protein BRD18_06670 [Halobacteriales archaeon SW_7_71_33]|nr:MAG: hypothetical protein BRD18_06670 [Halobacteriales archaeon SW_7_71_33]